MAVGWDLRTAMARTVPIRFLDWKRRAADRRSYVFETRPDSFSFDTRKIEYAEALRLRRAESERDYGHSVDQTHGIFREMMANGRLLAWGYRNGVMGEYSSIEPGRWRGLTVLGEENSSASDHTEQVGFVAVEVFPLLESPAALELVTGRRLGDILHDFVLRDPEVEALFEVQPPLPGSLCDFVGHAGDGGCLVPVSDSVREIELALQNVPIEAVRSVLASRLAALWRLLYGDNLVLIGFREGDEAEDEIEVSAGELRKPSLRLCLATGDFWQENASVSRRLYHAVRVKTREPDSADGAAEQQGRNKGGRPPSEDWKSAFNAVMARALKGGDLFTSAADLSQQMAEYATKHGLNVGKSDTERLARNWVKTHHPDIYGAVKSGSEE